MSDLTERVNQITKDEHAVSQPPVPIDPVTPTVKVSPAQLLKDTKAFHPTSSSPESRISSVGRMRLNSDPFLRPNTSEHSLVLSADASNTTNSDLDLTPVQLSEAESCPASPMPPQLHQENVTESAVTTTPTTSAPSSTATSNSSRPRTANSSSPVSSATTPTASGTIKRPRQKPSERRELLIRAVEDVLNSKISMRRAAQKHNLAKSSLCDFVRKNNISLPSLRVKASSAASDPSTVPSLSRAAGINVSISSNPGTSGLKRVSQESEEFSHSVKLSCLVDRKPFVVNKSRDSESHVVEMSSSNRASAGVTGSHTPCTFTHSPTSFDVLDSDQSSSRSPYTSLRSGGGSGQILSSSASVNPSNTISTNNCSGPSALSSHRSNPVSHSSKQTRIESPWSNSAGLPTQVPMRSWTVTHHHSHPINGTNVTPATQSNSSTERKQSLFNPMVQLRQTLGSSGCMSNLSDSNISAEHSSASLLRNPTEPTGSLCTETSGARQTPNSEGSDLGRASDGSDLMGKHSHDLNAHSVQDVDMTEPRSNSEAERGTFRHELNGTVEPLITGQLRLDSRPTSLASPHQCITDSISCANNVEQSAANSDHSSTAHPQEFSSLVYSLPVGFSTPLTSVSSVGLGNAAAAAAACLNDVNWLVQSRESRLSIPTFDSTQLNFSSQSNFPSVSDNPVSIAIGSATTSLCPGVNQIASFNAATVPTPSITPFLTATELSATNPTAAAVLAALVLQQQSRTSSSVSGTPAVTCPALCPNTASITAGTTLPNLIGYPPAQLTYPIPNCGNAVSVPTSNLATLYASNPFSNPTDLTIPQASSTGANASVSGIRLGSSRPPSLQSTISTNCIPQLSQNAQPLPSRITQPNLSFSDLLQQLGAEELHALLTRQTPNATSARSQSDSACSSSVFANALSTQLLPHLPYPALRHFLTALVGSASQRTSNLMSSVKPSTTGAPTLGTTIQDNLLSSPFPTNPTAGQDVTDACSSQLDSSMNPNMAKVHSHAKGLVDFINKSPSPFHAVQTACELLMAHGFRELKEHEPWTLHPSDCVFIRKNGSTVVAAAIGGKFKPGNPFHVIGAHTDSPCLRLKPFSERVKEGYIQLGVETYGGGLWYTWFDRELKLAGRVVTTTSSGRLKERLVHLDRPIACVPSLAIHLNQEIKVQGFQPNTEQHVVPILCTTLMNQVQVADGVECPQSGATGTTTNGEPSVTLGKRRHPAGLLHVLAQELGIMEHDILELELYFSDYQPARIGGLHNEFIHAPRLDNLFNSYTSLCGLVASLPTLDEENALRLVCLYDHEEIGSTSTQGANSAHTMNVLRRLVDALASQPVSDTGKVGEPSESDPNLSVSARVSQIFPLHFEESLSKSFLLSADQSHAVHPSYHERHEPNHKAQLHCGLILKYNSTQRYATNSLTAAAVRQIAQQAGVPVQEFTPRQDMHCGTTIGPLLSAQLGIPTVDVGFPQLAMHSCRELCCTTSVSQAVRFYSSFYDYLPKLWPPERE